MSPPKNIADTTETPWEELATKSQSGDQKSYAKLLTEIAPYIKFRVIARLANPDWADDIVQDVLISVHKSLGTYAPDRPFKPWLNAIIQFRKTDYLRSYYKKKETREHVQENSNIFDENVTFQADYGELKDIQQAIDTLPDKHKKIFMMMKIEGYSAKEVAKKMDMTVSAVKVSAHRTAGKLREILE